MTQDEIKDWLEWFVASHPDKYGFSHKGDLFVKESWEVLALLMPDRSFSVLRDLEFAIREEIKARGWVPAFRPFAVYGKKDKFLRWEYQAGIGKLENNKLEFFASQAGKTELEALMYTFEEAVEENND